MNFVYFFELVENGVFSISFIHVHESFLQNFHLILAFTLKMVEVFLFTVSYGTLSNRYIDQLLYKHLAILVLHNSIQTKQLQRYSNKGMVHAVQCYLLPLMVLRNHLHSIIHL